MKERGVFYSTEIKSFVKISPVTDLEEALGQYILYGIGNDLVKAGVPKDDIVPGFHPPELRKYVEYAVG
ncbi:MAG: XisI protein [Rivularia sp. (in: Bacteria)]|nr:XisI protein [Rivularia sp. MS3]